MNWEELLEDRLADAGLLFSGLDEDGRDETVIDAPVGEVVRVIAEALLSDETEKRVARAIARAENADYWAEEIDRWEQLEEWERGASPEGYPGMAYEDRGQFREAARAALTAAIEGEQ